MSSAPSSMWVQYGAPSGTARSSQLSKSRRTSGEAFSFSASEAEVCWISRWRSPTESSPSSGSASRTSSMTRWKPRERAWSRTVRWSHTAPSLGGLVLLHLGEGLETVQVAAHRPLGEPHPAACFLQQRVGLHVHADLDPGQPRRQLVEGDDAAVGEALFGVPFDPLVAPLVEDLRFELLGDAPDLGRERDGGIAFLLDAVDPVHEFGPFLVVRPLLVGVADRHRDVDRLLDRHPPAAAVRLRRRLPIITAVAVAVASAVAEEVFEPGQFLRAAELFVRNLAGDFLGAL